MNFSFQKFFSFVPARLFFAGLLLLTFSFHTIAFSHEHDERVFGDVQVIVHGEEKKWFGDFFLPVLPHFPSLLGAFFLMPLLCIASFSLFVSDPFREALRRGVIHPKLYS